MSGRLKQGVLIAVAAAGLLQASSVMAQGGGWDGKRRISYQDQYDLFYNYYADPNPSGAAAELYTAPLPVPENVGHTYNTYQPLYPHEHLYQHNRSWYTHNAGAGWTRTKARYRSFGLLKQAAGFKLHGHYPGYIFPLPTPLDPQ